MIFANFGTPPSTIGFVLYTNDPLAQHENSSLPSAAKAIGTMPSSVDINPPSNAPPPASPQRDTATLRVVQFSSPSRAAAFVSGIGNAVAGVIRVLSPPCRPLYEIVGESPFAFSLIDSSLSTSYKPEGSSVDGNNDGSMPQTQNVVEEMAEAILQMALDDEAEEGDGGGSDVKRGQVDDHFDAMMSVLDNNIALDEWGEISAPSIPGAPDGWIPPGPPITFLGYVPKLDAPAHFSDVDNPGRWSQFVFQPKYGQMNNRGPKVYVGHQTPAGAKVVPPNNYGIREVNGWKFHYQGWEPDNFNKSTYVRGTATKECLKPADRKGSLDANHLRVHGLSAERMKSSDPFFFSSCCCPFAIQCVHSGLDGDGRMPFFLARTTHTNGYAIWEKNWGGVYGHEYQLTTEQDLVHWMGVPIRHGARDGSASSLHWRWLIDNADYNHLIANIMNLLQWQQIKGVFKMNNNVTLPGCGQPGYDPAAKFNLIFRTLVHNMNYFTLRAELDAAADESTWDFMGYMGDIGGRLTNKPVGKGGQNTMLYDVSRRYPRAYVHRHKLHERPKEFNAKGKFEIKYLINHIKKLVVGNAPDEELKVVVPPPSGHGKSTHYTRRCIYMRPPHITCDNHFFR